MPPVERLAALLLLLLFLGGMCCETLPRFFVWTGQPTFLSIFFSKSDTTDLGAVEAYSFDCFEGGQIPPSGNRGDRQNNLSSCFFSCIYWVPNTTCALLPHSPPHRQVLRRGREEPPLLLHRVRKELGRVVRLWGEERTRKGYFHWSAAWKIVFLTKFLPFHTHFETKFLPCHTPFWTIFLPCHTPF